MVKCAECGFLAVRHRETRDLREAEGSYRDTGEIPRDLNRPKHLYEEVPLCFERLRIFDPQQCASVAGRQEELQGEIGPCVGFTEWHHGFTPKEHREMLDRERIVKRDDDIRKAIWVREDRRDAKAEQQHRDQMALLKGQHFMGIMFFGVFVIVATIAAAIIEGLLSRGTDLWPF